MITGISLIIIINISINIIIIIVVIIIIIIEQDGPRAVTLDGYRAEFNRKAVGNTNSYYCNSY